MGLSSKQVSNDLCHHPTTLLLQSQTLDLPSMKTPPPPPPPTATKRQLHHQEQLKCPRCESTNTKFCYYNNYNKLQPRHFCKTCKRHWTKGGTLRNVPIGGGRKNKRHKRYNNKPIAAAKVTTAPVTSGGSVKNVICNNTQMEIQSKNLASFPILNQFAISSITDVGFDSNSSTVTSVPHQDPQTLVQIPCSEKLTSFDTNPSLISTYPMEYPFGISGTTVMANTRSVGDGSVATVQQPWQVSSSTSSYLNWDIDDFDTFVSSSNLNIPWDDYYDIKP